MGIEIFGTIIPYYGLMIVAGLFFSSIIAYFLCKDANIDLNDFIIISGVLSLGVIIGGKLLYLIINFKSLYYIDIYDLKRLNLFLSSGFVFYGSLFGGIISIIILKRILRMDLKKHFNIIVVIVPVIHGFGRIGCHLVGCCYGIPYYYKNFPTRIYKASSFAPNNIPLFPVQLIESCCNFVIFFILLTYYFKSKSKKYIAELYLFLYSIIRFVLEFFRGDLARGILYKLSTSQLISIFIIIVVVFRIIFDKFKEYKLQRH